MSTAPKLSAADLEIVEQSAVFQVEAFRRHVGQISRQSSVFFAGTLFTAISGYVFKVYLARVLGAESLGIYALGMTMVGFFGIFNGLGLPQSAVRFVSAYSANAQFDRLRAFLGHGTLLLLIANFLLAGCFLGLGPWIAVRFYHTPALTRYLHFFVSIMFLGAITTFFGQVLAGYKDVARRIFITNFVGGPSTILLAVALLAMGSSLRGYLAAQVFSSILVLALMLWTIWRLTPRQARFLAGPLSRLDSEVLTFSSAVFGIGILEFSLAQADKILIGVFLNARDVGIYAVAVAVVGFVPIALQSVNQIFAPTIADLHARGEYELLQRLFQTLTKWICALTLPLATVVIVFSAPLMRIFGVDFQSGWPILVIGTLGQLVNCVVGSVGYLLLMSGHQRSLMKVQGGMAIVMVALGLALIPLWGLVGAVLAAAITNAVSNAWYLVEVRRRLRLFPYNRSYMRLLPPLVLTVCLVGALKSGLAALRPEWMTVMVSTIFAYIAFILVTVLVGLNSDDRMILDAVWWKLRGRMQRSLAVSL
jgi:O-antigen/teichoic acid export membrane protein